MSSDNLIPGFRGILGPMFSGKTTTLFALLRKHIAAGHRTALLSPRADTQNLEEHLLKTHDQVPMTATRIQTLEDALHAVGLFNRTRSVAMEPMIAPSPYLAIGIDEGQFVSFLPELLSAIEQACDMTQTFVYISALSGDFQRKLFPVMEKVAGLLGNNIHLTAVCKNCPSLNAPYSHRIVPGTEQYMPGAEDKYISVCHTCWVKLNPKKN